MSALLLIVPLAWALWPNPQPTEHITLLPNADGRQSAVVVTSARGETLVDQPYLTADVYASGKVTAKPAVASTVRIRYDSTLAALPAGAVSHSLFFEASSGQLAPESAARLIAIRADIARRAQPEVWVVGHADRADAPGLNDQLALSRAVSVARELAGAGVPEERIDVMARGSRDAKGFGGQNRRVDIRVR